MKWGEEMKQFDLYEFAGVLAPGTTFLVVISVIFPEIGELIQKQDITLGSLGLIVILSYVGGHIVQGVGDLLEKFYWYWWGGKPTDWVRTCRKEKIISLGQFNRLEKCLSDILQSEQVSSIGDLSRDSWQTITQEVYGLVKLKGMDSRAYIFNSNYSLMRGISAAVLLAIAMIWLRDGIIYNKYICILFCGLVISFYRMHRFGIHYARELFTSYLSLSQFPEQSEKTPE